MSAALSSGIHSPRLHTILYSFLLVATPFVLLQNFLVEQISRLSGSTITIADVKLPIMGIIAVVLVIGLGLKLRSALTVPRLIGGLIVLLMLAIANQVTDYYFGHHFYDLQQNWHYMAYGIFAFMLYRDLAPRKIPGAKIMLITYLLALGFSAFDEFFQMFLSSRVFDIGDIGKDLWGCLMGIVLIYFATTDASTLKDEWRQVRRRRPKDYLRHRSSLLVLMFAFALLFLNVSSLLTERQYVGYAILLVIGGLLIFFFVLHLSKNPWFKVTVLVILAALLLAQSYSFLRNRHNQITHDESGLTTYKGIPLLFFDTMIYPNGTMRLVDKKSYFNSRDQEFMMKQGADIVVIASGEDGSGGQGFPKKAPVQFIYNHFTQRGMQVIVQRTAAACQTFSRLKREGKNVLFILHNT